MKQASILIFFLLVVFTQPYTISWTGDSGSWSNPENWTPDRIPLSTDEVYISGSCKFFTGSNSVVDINLDINATIMSIKLEGPNLNIASHAPSQLVLSSVEFSKSVRVDNVNFFTQDTSRASFSVETDSNLQLLRLNVDLQVTLRNAELKTTNVVFSQPITCYGRLYGNEKLEFKSEVSDPSRTCVVNADKVVFSGYDTRGYSFIPSIYAQDMYVNFAVSFGSIQVNNTLTVSNGYEFRARSVTTKTLVLNDGVIVSGSQVVATELLLPGKEQVQFYMSNVTLIEPESIVNIDNTLALQNSTFMVIGTLALVAPGTIYSENSQLIANNFITQAHNDDRRVQLIGGSANFKLLSITTDTEITGVDLQAEKMLLNAPLTMSWLESESMEISVFEGGSLTLTEDQSLSRIHLFLYNGSSVLSPLNIFGCHIYTQPGNVFLQSIIATTPQLSTFTIDAQTILTVNGSLQLDDTVDLSLYVTYNPTAFITPTVIADNSSKISNLDIMFEPLPESWDVISSIPVKQITPFMNTMHIASQFEIIDNSNGVVTTTYVHSGTELVSINIAQGFCYKGCVHGQCTGIQGCKCIDDQWTGERCDTQTTIPLAPYDVITDNMHDRMIRIIFTAHQVATANIMFCDIYNHGNLIAQVRSNTTAYQYDHYGVVPGIEYMYTIDCINSYGRGNMSNPNRVKAYGKASAPLLTVIDIGAKFMTIQYTIPESFPPVTKILIFRDTINIGSTKDGETEYSDNEVENGKQYKYFVIGQSELGHSNVSNIIDVATLDYPGNFGCRASYDGTKTTITWVSPTNKGNPPIILGYNIRKKDAIVRTTNETSYVEEGVLSGRTVWTLSAFNKAGEGSQQEVAVTPNNNGNNIGLYIGLGVGGGCVTMYVVFMTVNVIDF
jgi:hypothetical protein